MKNLTEQQANIWSEYQADISAQWNPGDFERIYKKWCFRPEDFQFIKEFSIDENFKEDFRKIKEENSYRTRIKNRYQEFKKNNLKSDYLDNLMAEIKKVEIINQKEESIMIKGATQSSFTAEELMAMTLPEPKWAIPNILPEGLNILAGKPKMGKSVFSLNISISIACGGKALSEIEVEKGAVLYLALEDTKRRLQSRLKAMMQDRSAPNNLYLETVWPKIGDGGIKALDKRIREIPGLRLVIIDTLKKIKPVQKSQNKSLYDIDYELVTAVKSLADKYSVSILIIHHLRKTESDDVMDDFSGTFGLTGAADGLLAFIRKTGQANAVLHIVGRDVDAAEYALKYHPDIWTWELLGDAQEVKTTALQQLVYDTIKKAEQPIKPKEIEQITKIKYRTISSILNQLINEGSIEKAFKYGSYKIKL